MPHFQYTMLAVNKAFDTDSQEYRVVFEAPTGEDAIYGVLRTARAMNQGGYEVKDIEIVCYALGTMDETGVICHVDYRTPFYRWSICDGPLPDANYNGDSIPLPPIQ